MRNLANRFLPDAQLPPALPRHARQPPRRIHRNSISSSLKHLQVSNAVAVRITPCKIDPVTRSNTRNRPQFRATAHMFSRNAPIPNPRSTCHDFQFRSAHLDFRGNQPANPPRHHPRQRRQSAANNKHAMTLRAVPHDPLQRFLKESQRIPAIKFQPKRLLPLIRQPLADPAEIPFVSHRSAVQVPPSTSSKSRQPPLHLPARNFIVLQQISNEPPLQRRRRKHRAIQIEKRAHTRGASLLRDHRIPSIAAAVLRLGIFRSTAARSRYRRPSHTTGTARAMQKTPAAPAKICPASKSE